MQTDNLAGSEALIYEEVHTQADIHAHTKHTHRKQETKVKKVLSGRTARVNKTVTVHLHAKCIPLYCRTFEACTNKCIAKFIFII